MEWTPIYLMIILVIAAVLILAIVKPMFQGAAQYAETAVSFLLF
jgi:hypothetical protein